MILRTCDPVCLFFDTNLLLIDANYAFTEQGNWVIYLSDYPNPFIREPTSVLSRIEKSISSYPNAPRRIAITIDIALQLWCAGVLSREDILYCDHDWIEDSDWPDCEFFYIGIRSVKIGDKSYDFRVYRQQYFDIFGHGDSIAVV